jgi:F-type H+-transporting ATPase subunit delta
LELQLCGEKLSLHSFFGEGVLDVRQNQTKMSRLNVTKLTASELELKEKVDASIIGGLVVQIEDKLFDASIKHDLLDIKRQFIKNMYVRDIR